MNLLQSYRDFWLIPNIFLESFPTCCDSADDLRQSRGKRLNRVVNNQRIRIIDEIHQLTTRIVELLKC